MRIAVHVLAYDVDRYINAMLRNVAPHVDKIYLAYPKRPWNYIPTSRESRTNPTKLSSIFLKGFEGKMEIIEGDWEKEEDTRNECLRRAKLAGFDWLLTQDADEFYTDESWRQIRRTLISDQGTDLFKTTWYNFWKSSEFIIGDAQGSIKDVNAGFALRCKPELRFSRSRTTNAQTIKTLDCPCYHYGYVKSDREMYEKVTQWGHAHQFDGERWHKLKWLNWNLNTINLCPLFPVWKRALRFPLTQPEFAHEFAIPYSTKTRFSPGEYVQEISYDAWFNAYYGLRAVKQKVFGYKNREMI